jgi:hypothetical protein
VFVCGGQNAQSDPERKKNYIFFVQGPMFGVQCFLDTKHNAGDNRYNDPQHFFEKI